jgi:hypothetical protein
MSKDAGWPESGVTEPDADTDPDAEPVPGALPPHDARSALWVASACALTAGVIGTVAYETWFNHDQRTYADAVARAREALGQSDLALSTQETCWPRQVTTPTMLPSSDAGCTQPVMSVQFYHFGPPQSAAPQLTKERLRTNHVALQSRAHSSPRNKASGASSSGFFGHMRSFFRRVSYRQSGAGDQQNGYAHR